MTNFKDRVFVNPKELLRPSARIVFVSDLFTEDYVGGAELTSEALIEESPYEIQKLHSRNVSLSTLQQGVDKFWIFGNFAQLNPELIPSIVANIKYTILEYDYKYCKYRSPEKHFSVEGIKCDCQNQITGKLISAFYYGSKCLWWMSEKQKQRYLELFPFLSEKDNIVLSSVYSKNILNHIQRLRKANAKEPKQGWIVLGSDSWIKGAEEAKKWCEINNKNYEVVWGITYDKMLEKLSKAEGFVYLPLGADTCPRMVIEAKLLGCELIINDNVQNASEEWFNTQSIEIIQDYLSSATTVFWSAISTLMDYKPRISGYTTTYNCVTQGYPFMQSIKSMLQFCDEVCVVDGGSSDGTWELLESLDAEVSGYNGQEESKYPGKNIVLKQVPRDWSHPRHAVFDGKQKAEARAMCTGDFCWQMDSDEIVHEDDSVKVIDLCKKMPKNADIIALPVIEFWGGPDKVRCDIQPWKWRLSRNKPDITHGIPIDLRRTDENGNSYAAEGTDGCDMIHSDTGQRLPHITFHTIQSEKLRQAAIADFPGAHKAYEEWFNLVVQNLPGVHHYSWYDMVRKIKTYKNYWTKHWNSLYNKSIEDTAENNMFFDLPWSQVTDDMIEKRASEIKEGTGGWVWHKKWNNERMPWIIVNRAQPKIML